MRRRLLLRHRAFLGSLVVGLTALVLTVPPAGAAMPSTSGLGPRAGVVVRDVQTGKILLNRHGAVRRIPASVTKLFTVAGALLELGPQWTPRTRVVASGTAVGAVWTGDLYLVGGGDPTLSRATLTRLAEQTVSALKARSLSGGVRYDDSAFDPHRGGDRTGARPDGDMGGQLGGLTVDRGARTTDPGQRAASLFRNALKAAGLRVTGKLQRATAPPNGQTVATAVGPSLAQLTASTLLPSDNFVAETLLKDLVARDGVEAACRRDAGLRVLADPDAPAATPVPAAASRCAGTGAAAVPASTRNASSHLRTALKPLLGATPRIYDGSGLTRRNRVSPAMVTQLLVRLSTDADLGPVLQAALPAAGRSGTLTSRMRGTAAVGRCQAKTGTINGVSALAGLCRTKRGHDVAFAILQNGSSPGSARRFQDRFVARLAARG